MWVCILQNDENCYINGTSSILYPLLSLTVVKSRRLKWTEHVARVEEGGVLSKF